MNDIIRLVSSRALERTLNHRSTTSIRGDMRSRCTLSRGVSGITSTTSARAAPSGFTRSTSISGINRLASSRALERTVNHRSTTSIRGDTSTRDTRSTGVTSRSTVGTDDGPSSIESTPSLTRTRAHTCCAFRTLTRRTNSAHCSWPEGRPRQWGKSQLI